MGEELLNEGVEVHVTTDVMGVLRDEDGAITTVNPGDEYPYGVSLDSGIYIRAAAHCVTLRTPQRAAVDTPGLDARELGSRLLERAAGAIYRRRYTDRTGNNWSPGHGKHPWHVGANGRAVLDHSDDGARYQVNVYTLDGLHAYRREFATLDAALRNGTRVAKDGPTPAEHAEAWNATYPVGTSVRYWTGAREGAGQTGRTTCAAWVAEGHTAVVRVTGHGAWIGLTHVQPIPETEA